jgi:chromosome partitioning protein
MERGAPHLHEMMRSGIDARLKALAAMGVARSMYVQDTELIALAVTRVQSSRGYSGYTDDHTQHLRSMERQWGKRLVKPYIGQGTGLSQALSEGVPVYDRGYTQNVGGRGLDDQYTELTKTLKERIDAI